MSDLERFRPTRAAGCWRTRRKSMFTPAALGEDICWGGRKAQFPPTFANGSAHGRARLTAPTWPRNTAAGTLRAGGKGSPGRGAEPQLRRRSPASADDDRTALLHEGSEEQKREHLPKIVRGEIRCARDTPSRVRLGPRRPADARGRRTVTTSSSRTENLDLLRGPWDWMFILVRTDPMPRSTPASASCYDMSSPGVAFGRSADQRLLTVLRDVLQASACRGETWRQGGTAAGRSPRSILASSAR